MKFRIRQRIFSWFDSFDITNEEGNTVFTVRGQLSWGHHLHFFTPQGEDIASVKEAVVTVFPEFAFYVHGQYAGMLKRRFSPLHPQYDLNFNNWHVSGDFMNRNWQIEDENNRVIATIQRKLLHLSDNYVIDVKEEKDVLYALMLTVAIDAERCTAAKRS